MVKKGVVRGQPAAPAGRRSALTGMTFHVPDLNKITETIRRNREQGVANPEQAANQLYATPEGEILTGTVVGPNPGQRLSVITQETFYADTAHGTGIFAHALSRITKASFWVEAEPTPPDRHSVEQGIVRDKMPAGTVFATDGAYDGWVYSVTSEFDDTYELYLWYDPSGGGYKVSLLSPKIAGSVSAHGCHLYSDGTLCLKENGGYRDMANAYARSVLWTRGASCYQRGYGFMFNGE